MPPGRRLVRSGELGDGRAGPGADPPFERSLLALGGQGSGVAGVGIGESQRVADAQVEEDRGRHDRHRSYAGGEPDAALGEAAHDAIRGGQSEGRAAGEADGVDSLDEGGRTKEIRLARARRGAADVDSGHRPGVGREDDGAAGQAGRIGPVADPEAGDVAQREVLGHGPMLAPGWRSAIMGTACPRIPDEPAPWVSAAPPQAGQGAGVDGRRPGRPHTDGARRRRSARGARRHAPLRPGRRRPPFAATVRFSGRREGVVGKPQPGDTFTVDERIDRVVPGSGPLSVTARAYGLNPGEWTVTAQLSRSPGVGPSRTTAAKSGQTLPRARWSWLRWRLDEATFGPVRTRWGPMVRLTAMPAVIHGSWTALVGLGVVIGIGAMLWLLSFEGIAPGPALLVNIVGVLGGIVGAKLWYIVLRPRQWRKSLGEGWSIDGSIAAAPIAAVIAMLILDLPVLAFLDAALVAFGVGVGIGRLGCFFTGCCAGRCTASRWGVWSSDRRVGARRIPTQLMEAGLGIGLAIVFGALDISGIVPIDGVVFVVGIGSYLAGRQLLLRLRADARSSSLGMEGRRRATAV